MNGPTSISISQINAFCQLFSIEAEQEIGMFVTLIQRMDMAYLELMNKKKPEGNSN